MKNIFESKNLTYRSIQEEDKSYLYDILSDKQTCMDDGGYPPEDKKSFPSTFNYLLKSKEHYAIVLKEENHLVGLLHIMEEDNVKEIGYIIHPNYRKKGYGKETLKSVCDYLFTQDVKQIKCTCYDYNIVSKKIMESTGFTYIGSTDCNHPQKGNIQMLSYIKEGKV